MKSNLPHLYPHLPNSEHTTGQPEPSLVFFAKKKQVLEKAEPDNMEDTAA